MFLEVTETTGDVIFFQGVSSFLVLHRYREGFSPSSGRRLSWAKAGLRFCEDSFCPSLSFPLKRGPKRPASRALCACRVPHPGGRALRFRPSPFSLPLCPVSLKPWKAKQPGVPCSSPPFPPDFGPVGLQLSLPISPAWLRKTGLMSLPPARTGCLILSPFPEGGTCRRSPGQSSCRELAHLFMRPCSEPGPLRSLSDLWRDGLCAVLVYSALFLEHSPASSCFVTPICALQGEAYSDPCCMRLCPASLWHGLPVSVTDSFLPFWQDGMFCVPLVNILSQTWNQLFVQGSLVSFTASWYLGVTFLPTF